MVAGSNPRAARDFFRATSTSRVSSRVPSHGRTLYDLLSQKTFTHLKSWKKMYTVFHLFSNRVSLKEITPSSFRETMLSKEMYKIGKISIVVDGVSQAELDQILPGETRIGTDGSFRDRAGCSILIQENLSGKYAFTFLMCLSLETADSTLTEAVALWAAFRLAADLCSPCVIVTDSKSLLNRLKGIHKKGVEKARKSLLDSSAVKDDLLIKILDIGKSLDFPVRLQWVKSHGEIVINNAADKVACHGRYLPKGTHSRESATRAVLETLPCCASDELIKVDNPSPVRELLENFDLEFIDELLSYSVDGHPLVSASRLIAQRNQ